MKSTAIGLALVLAAGPAATQTRAPGDYSVQVSSHQSGSSVASDSQALANAVRPDIPSARGDDSPYVAEPGTGPAGGPTYGPSYRPAPDGSASYEASYVYPPAPLSAWGPPH